MLEEKISKMYNEAKTEINTFRVKQEKLKILIQMLELFKEIKENCFEEKAINCINIQIEKVHLLLLEIINE